MAAGLCGLGVKRCSKVLPLWMIPCSPICEFYFEVSGESMPYARHRIHFGGSYGSC